MQYLRQILVGLIVLALVVLMFVLVIKGFSSNNGKSTIKQADLVSYANTSAVADLYIDGPIVADQDHRTVHISVSQNQTQIDVIQGYQGSVIATQNFPNNATSYAVFLQALKNLNFAKGNTDPAAGDERGVCAQNDRFVYKFNDGSKDLFRFWSTSCGQGTFGGNRQAVRLLFQRQIPEKVFDQLTGNISLN